MFGEACVSVQPLSAPVLHDLTLETLQRVRQALGLTLAEVAAEADRKPHTIAAAEHGETHTRSLTLKGIGEVLVRLEERRPENEGA